MRLSARQSSSSSEFSGPGVDMIHHNLLFKAKKPISSTIRLRGDQGDPPRKEAPRRARRWPTGADRGPGLDEFALGGQRDQAIRPQAISGISKPLCSGWAKRQQVLVESVLERRGQAGRGALVELQDRALDELVLEHTRVGVRHDLVVGPA